MHYWWHEMARNYHEPEPFRYSLGAFVQATRNVTWVLQKEKRVFEDFSWYEEWAARAKQDSLLRWLTQTRNSLVKQQALETYSWLELVCVGKPPNPHGRDEDEDEDPFRIRVSPFMCTHYYIFSAPPENHSHEFIRFWGINDLGQRELLEACADIYDQLDDLLQIAHEKVGAKMQSSRRPRAKRPLPCMENILEHRIARTALRDGREVWEGEPPGLHKH